MGSGILFSLIVLLVVTVFDQPVHGYCPPAQSILPCKCYYYSELTIRCESGIGDFARIKSQLIPRLRFSRGKMTIIHLNRSIFDKSILSGLGLYSFELYKSTGIKEISQDAFNGLENKLKHLGLMQTSLDHVPVSAISKLKILDSLQIRNAKIQKITKADIDKLPQSLTSLDFGANPISSVESFRRLHGLQRLYLGNSSLKSLPKDCFGPRVKHLYLWLDHFTTVPMEAFANLMGSRVTLVGNQIQTLPSENLTKAFFDRKNYLYLDKNPLECTCDLKWLPKYRALHGGAVQIYGKCVGDSHRKSKHLSQLSAPGSKAFQDCH